MELGLPFGNVSSVSHGSRTLTAQGNFVQNPHPTETATFFTLLTLMLASRAVGKDIVLNTVLVVGRSVHADPWNTLFHTAAGALCEFSICRISRARVHRDFWQARELRGLVQK